MAKGAGKITPETTQHVAHLARIRLTPEEIGEYTRQLSAVLEHIEQLFELDVENVAPLMRPFEEPLRFREDEPVKNDSMLEWMEKNSPVIEGRAYQVPAILE